MQAVLENVQAIAREYVQSDGTPEARPPQGTPRNSTASSQPSNWAKLDSASVATPADVMARQTDSVQLEFDQYVAQAPISRSSCPMLLLRRC